MHARLSALPYTKEGSTPQGSRSLGALWIFSSRRSTHARPGVSPHVVRSAATVGTDVGKLFSNGPQKTGIGGVNEKRPSHARKMG
jgi:hypothetical protein